MDARQPGNLRQRRSARHEGVLSLKISWWMTHDRCGMYAFHVHDWRGWPGVHTLTSGSCLGEVL